MSVSRSSVSVSTSAYQFAHGRAPRGDGSWAFYFAGESEPRWFQGSYSAARAEAVRVAAEAGCSSVSVGS